MNAIDIIFLVLLTTSAVSLILRPIGNNRILKTLIAFIFLLAVIQLMLYGFYRYYLACYLLLFIMGFTAIFLNRDISKIKKRLLRITLVSMLVVSFLPWAILTPTPELIQPEGKFKVGTRIFRWVDSLRAESITPDTNDKRNVVVQAWYPIDAHARGAHSLYLDGLNRLPKKVGFIPEWVFDHYEKVNTHGILNAPIAERQGKWPVVLFLTGNGAARAFYTSFVAGLASRGYVVLAIDHPYEAMITELANGKLVTTIEKYAQQQPDLQNFMKGRLETRIADVQFVLNQLDNPQAFSDDFPTSLDQNRIVITGHSLGGASAAAAMAHDLRITAAANIDGTLYGELPKPQGARPFLLIESKKEAGRFQRYEEGNKRLFKQFGGGYRFEIPQADHYSFTDAPFMLAVPARFIVSRFQKVGQIPEKTNHATIGILDAFFSHALDNKDFDEEKLAKSYPGVIRKRL